MAKTKSLKSYINALWTDIESQRGERPAMLRHLVEKTAKDQRHLDIVDEQIEDIDYTSVVRGSTGQQKTEVNPLVIYRDKVSRTVTDDLKELQLTAGSVYKKKDQTRLHDEDEINNTTADYFRTVQG